MSDIVNVREERKSTFLSKDVTLCLKGILACMVLISHLHGRVGIFSSNILGTAFSSFGYLAVSMFLFLSGYGVNEQAKANPSYVGSFLKRRILPFYLVGILTIVIYLLRDVVFYGFVSWKAFALSFFIGGTIVDNGWYLQVQLMLYILFLAAFLLPKKWQIPVIFCGSALWCLTCALLGLATTWYEAVFCFAFGIIVSNNRENIATFLQSKKNGIVALLVSLIVFTVFLFFGNRGGLVPEWLRISIKILSALLFTVVAVIAVNLVNICNAVTRVLGKISLEIYVLQGIALALFKDTFEIKNDWLYILAVLATVFAMSILMHPIYVRVNSVGRKKVKKPKDNGEKNDEH